MAVTPRDQTGILQAMIEQNDEKQSSAHHRLRVDFRELATESAVEFERCRTETSGLKLDMATMKTAREAELRMSGQRIILLGSLVGALSSFAVGLALLLVRKALGF